MARRPQQSSGDYVVGYGRPPVETRFKPGQSGNPRGRPKRVRDQAAILEDALNARVAIIENGRRRYLSMWEVIVRRLVNGAAQGDQKFIRLLFDSVRRPAAAGAEARSEPAAVAAEDDLIIAGFLARHGTAPLPADAAPTDGIADEDAARDDNDKASEP